MNTTRATGGMDARMAEAVRLSSVAGLSPPLVRAGRALLGWSKLDLARIAGVSVSSLLRMEGGPGLAGRAGTADARVREALEAAGLRFVGTRDGGVRIRMGADEVEVAGPGPRGPGRG